MDISVTKKGHEPKAESEPPKKKKKDKEKLTEESQRVSIHKMMPN